MDRMEPRVDFLTLATPDLDAARRFYRDGLGWEPLLDVPGEILFFQIGFGQVLGLFDAVQFGADLASADDATPTPDGAPTPTKAPTTTVSGLTLSRNVAGPAEVREVVETMIAAGGTLVKPPQTAAFGGYHGHVADPNGVLWEVAFNPGWSVDADGLVTLEVVDP